MTTKTPDSVIPPAPTELKTLWDECQKRLARHAQEMAETVTKLIALGQGLVAECEKLKHGQVGDWLEANFGGGSERSAYNYMSLGNLAKIATVAKIVDGVVKEGIPLKYLYG